MEKLKAITPGQEASSARSTEDLRKSRESLILRCQRIIFSAYRTDQYSDPEGYLTSLGAVLEQYPNEVIVYVTDPRTGVQRACKWPPTISEIVEACDARAADLKRQERYRNWGKGNGAPMLEAPRESRPTPEEMRAKYGENWGLSDPMKNPERVVQTAPSWDKIVEGYSTDPSRLERLLRKDSDPTELERHIDAGFSPSTVGE